MMPPTRKGCLPSPEVLGQMAAQYDAAPKSEEASAVFEEFADGFSPCGEGLEYR